MKRARFLFLTALVAIGSVGCSSLASAGAATSRHSGFCTSLKPAVQASQQLAAVRIGVSSHAAAKTKSELLTAIRMLLNADSSIKVQLRSAPAKVQASFRWDVLTEGRVKTALEQATTKRQIQAAMRELDGSIDSHPREAPFIIYSLSQCEGRPAPAGAAATP